MSLNSRRKAIREMIPIIDPEEDYLTIAAAEEQMSLTEEERRKEIGEAQSRVRCQLLLCLFPETSH